MKIAIGADHKGYVYKESIKKILATKGHYVNDHGAASEESVDYPDFAISVGTEVISKVVDFGILICWTGNGMALAANKIRGVRAGVALNPEMAELMRLHNDANILVLAAKYTPLECLGEIVDSFLTTKFEGGRHQRRLDKIKKYEDKR